MALTHLPALDSYLRQQVSQHFVVAYSGGVDSCVLLHLMHAVLAEYPQHQLSAIHINHGLSPKANQWQQHCVEVCEALNIPLQVKLLSLERQNRQSLEAVARQARYLALEQLSPEGAIIVLGQHQDDQTETFLLQLKRGAGPKGLSAMPVEQALGDKQLLRPLLNVSQQQILNYARLHALRWVEDDSNQDIDFDRNFLRHKVLPQLQQRWSGFDAAVARSASLCAEQQKLLEEVTEQKLAQCLVQTQILNLDQLLSLSVAWQKQVIRLWLANVDIAMPSEAWLKQLLQQLDSNRDAVPEIRFGDWVFRRFQQQLYLLPWHEPAVMAALTWSGEEKVTLGAAMQLYISTTPVENSLALAFSPEQDALEIRFDSLSQRFKPEKQPMSKPLKQWYKLWSVPPWERQQIPQILLNGQLVALGDMAISADYLPEPTARTFYLHITREFTLP